MRIFALDKNEPEELRRSTQDFQNMIQVKNDDDQPATEDHNRY
jgi:hypothetical protein